MQKETAAPSNLRSLPSPGESIVEQLQRARVQAGITQRQLAGAIGVSLRTLSLWEHGAVKPTSENLARWSGALNQ